MHDNRSWRLIANLIIGISIIAIPIAFPSFWGRGSLESTIIYSSFSLNIGVADVYSRWLKEKDSIFWEDIVGIPEFFSERFRSISCGVEQRASHKVFVLRDFSHIINFIILSFPEKNRKSVVYFGWIANDIDRVSEIYSSTDEDVVAMFRGQFANLKAITWNALDELKIDFKNGFDIDHSYPIPKKVHIGPSGLIDKSGLWETISFHKDQNGDLIMGSLATVAIRFNIDHVEVTSELYDIDGLPLGDFTSQSESTFSLNNLFFVYKTKGDATTGICHYKFFRHHSEGRMLTGVFCDSMLQSRNTVIGFYHGDNTNEIEKYSPEIAKQRISILKDRVESLEDSAELKNGPSLGLL